MSATLNTVIHTRGFSATPAISEHLNRRFTLALERFSDLITRIDVYMKDLNGSEKGGEDQSVVVSVKLRGHPELVTETTTHDLYMSLSLAARRTRRVVGRTLKRYNRFNRMAIDQLCFPRSTSVDMS
jgi:ribosome-associated translation inhibitor RaiA